MALTAAEELIQKFDSSVQELFTEDTKFDLKNATPKMVHEKLGEYKEKTTKERNDFRTRAENDKLPETQKGRAKQLQQKKQELLGNIEHALNVSGPLQQKNNSPTNPKPNPKPNSVLSEDEKRAEQERQAKLDHENEISNAVADVHKARNAKLDYIRQHLSQNLHVEANLVSLIFIFITDVQNDLPTRITAPFLNRKINQALAHFKTLSTERRTPDSSSTSNSESSTDKSGVTLTPIDENDITLTPLDENNNPIGDSITLQDLNRTNPDDAFPPDTRFQLDLQTTPENAASFQAVLQEELGANNVQIELFTPPTPAPNNVIENDESASVAQSQSGPATSVTSIQLYDALLAAASTAPEITAEVTHENDPNAAPNVSNTNKLVPGRH